MQKRGELIVAEDFLPLTKTYPKHPISDYEPNAHNQHELANQRKEATLADIRKQQQAWASKVQAERIKRPKVPDEGYVESPQYTSIKQKIDEKKRNLRLKAELTEIVEEPKAKAGEIGLDYVRNPINKTYTDLKK